MCKLPPIVATCPAWLCEVAQGEHIAHTQKVSPFFSPPQPSPGSIFSQTLVKLLGPCVGTVMCVWAAHTVVLRFSLLTLVAFEANTFKSPKAMTFPPCGMLCACTELLSASALGACPAPLRAGWMNNAPRLPRSPLLWGWLTLNLLGERRGPGCGVPLGLFGPLLPVHFSSTNSPNLPRAPWETRPSLTLPALNFSGSGLYLFKRLKLKVHF